jgi:glucosyl-3-phosphoglycerate synthase
MTQINPLMRKMIVFEMDNTILQGRFIDTCAKKYNFRQALALLQNIDKNSISLTKRIASFLKGKSVQELEKVADDMPMVKDMHEVMQQLKQRNYIIGIITDSYQVVAQHIAQRIGADFYLSYELEVNEGSATGGVCIPSHFYYSEKSSCDHPVCKTNALRYVCELQGVSMHNCIVVGDSENDLCMVRHAGLGVAFCTSSELLRAVAPKKITKPEFSELLEYAR